MCDPIPDKRLFQDDAFREEVVLEYLGNRQSFTRYPRRHYSQLEVEFDSEELRRQIEKIDVPIENTRVTVFGGFTGQFALSLKSLGMTTVFTDPLEDWVSNARSLGMEAYKYTAQEIPRELLERTDLFATFECYPIMFGNNKLWVFLRLLTAKMGVLFVESQRTFREMVEEQESEGTERHTRLKSDFLPFAKVYKVNRQQRSRRGGELVFYHFSAEESSRQLMRRDWKTLKALHDNFLDRTLIGDNEIRQLSAALKMSESEVTVSIQRLFLLYRLNLGAFGRQYLDLDKFDFFSKNFVLDPRHIPAEALILPPLTAKAYDLLKRFHPERLEDL